MKKRYCRRVKLTRRDTNFKRKVEENGEKKWEWSLGETETSMRSLVNTNSHDRSLPPIHMHMKNSLVRPNKKRSLLRLTWLKFLRVVGFFLLKIFYTHIWYANLYFSRAGNSNSTEASLPLKHVIARVAQATRVLDCWPCSTSTYI